MERSQYKRKIIAVVGSTASGKSALAIRLAKKFSARGGGAEVISADSRQIYKGLEIGSGAVTGKETAGIPHHLIGFVNPKKTFTAAEYKKLARKEIKRVWKRGKLPIMAGGTGLYIRAALDGLVMPEVKPNKTLREKLEKMGIGELSRTLEKLDKRRWKDIDKKNPRRLIRAIEIAKKLGKVPELKLTPIDADILFIGVAKSGKPLEESIRKRVKKMLGSGLIRETQKLIDSGIGESKIREFGFEYSDTLAFIRKEIGSKPELREKMVKDTLKYAKRQKTWFKKDRRIHWVKTAAEALDLAGKFVYY
jgi:tRNA dimethylallyltransferase